MFNVWRSNFGSNGSFFVHEGTVTVNAEGQVTIHVAVDDVVTLTTTSGQTKGEFTGIPADAPFPTNYSDDFDGYTQGAPAAYVIRMFRAIFQILALRSFHSRAVDFIATWVADSLHLSPHPHRLPSQ